MTLFRCCVCVVLLLRVSGLFPSAHLVAQQREAGAGRGEIRALTAAGVPLARAVPVDEGPLVDGDVLNDPAYTDATPATGFVQSRPFEGEAASERTEVRIVYTAETLWSATESCAWQYHCTRTDLAWTSPDAPRP